MRLKPGGPGYSVDVGPADVPAIKRASVMPLAEAQARPSFSRVSAVIRLTCTLAGSPGILG
jgi:hypothetical protein